MFLTNQHFAIFEVKSTSLWSQVDVKSTFYCLLSEKKTSLRSVADFSTCQHLKTPPEKIEFFVYMYVMSRKRSKNQLQKYRTMFFYYVEDHM